ncbi:MAG TPA: hypothetical protein VEJ88_05740 [Dissulfurispiraceae bacterium]|nr:hypothetical protein [Dissulfurispiraceae bacterium]
MKSDNALLELLDPELSRVMEAAAEDRIRRDQTLTPDEYLQWITSMSQFIPKPPFESVEG